jgi:hypothetical protein
VDANELVTVTVEGLAVWMLEPRAALLKFKFTAVVVTVTPYDAVGVIVTVSESCVFANAVPASAISAAAAASLIFVFMRFLLCV